MTNIYVIFIYPSCALCFFYKTLITDNLIFYIIFFYYFYQFAKINVFLKKPKNFEIKAFFY